MTPVKWRTLPGFVEWFRLQASQLTNAELAEKIRVKFGVANVNRNRLTRLRDEYAACQTPETKRRAYAARDKHVMPLGAFVPSFVRELGPTDEEYFVHVTGDCFITSDWHIPHHKESLVDRLCQMAEAWRVKTLVINGDFLNEDAFSKHKGHRFQVPWKIEREVAQDLLQRLFRTFHEVVYILDNHDRRIIAANEKPHEFDESNVIQLLAYGVKTKRLRPSVDYHYVLVNKKWRVTSPKEYRRTKLSLPSRLAQVYGQDVVVGGDHLFGLGMDDSNRYVIANSMCLVDPTRTPYINVQDTTFPHWTPGFYMIWNDRLRAYPDVPQLTDWDEALRVGEWLSGKRRKRVP